MDINIINILSKCSIKFRNKQNKRVLTKFAHRIFCQWRVIQVVGNIPSRSFSLYNG